MTEIKEIKRNAAGVPLVLIGTAAGNAVTIDQSEVPIGINGKRYTLHDVDVLNPDDQQLLMNGVWAKYDGVEVDVGPTHDLNEEFAMTVDDFATYHELLAVGAKRPAEKPAIAPGDVQPAFVPPTQNTLIVVPQHVAEQLPVGTIVTKTAEGAHVASIPVDGTTHHIWDSIGAQLPSLLAAVSAYFGARRAQTA